MTYVDETGTVVAIKGDTAVIKLDHKEKDECGSCCACSAFGAGEDGVRVAAGQLKQGDRVVVRVPQVNAYLSMFLVFGLPLLLFFAGMFVGRAMERTEYIGNVALVGGVAGLLIAFGLAAVIDRVFMGKARPEVQGPAPGSPQGR